MSTEKLEFVLGSSYQRSSDYVMDVYRLAAMTSEHDCRKAGAEIVKQSTNAPMSGLLYPILQVLDEEYLKVDAELGGMSNPTCISTLFLTQKKAWTRGSSSPQQQNGYPNSDTER